MSENPYKSPGQSAPPEPGPMPAHVRMVLILYTASVLVALADLIAQVTGFSRSEMAIAIQVLGMSFSLVIVCLLLWRITRGDRWAVFVYAGLTVLGAPLSVPTILKELNGDLLGAASTSLQIVLGLVSVVFLFTPSARAWFRSIREARTADRP